MTRLLLSRHGATTFAADRFAGSTDVPLSTEGEAQAGQLSERLADQPIAAIYCSPLIRTIATAAIVARPHGLTPIARDGWREIDHGRWEGLHRAEAETLFPDEYAAWVRDPFAVAPVGGETGQQVLARAMAALDDVLRDHHDQTVMVVSHKATIRLVIAELLGFDPRSYRDRLDQLPACLNIVDFLDTSGPRLVLLNDVSHYRLIGESDRIRAQGTGRRE